MTRKKKKTIVFDFDGPIVDSFDAAFRVAKMISPTLTYENYRKRFSQNIFTADAAAPEPKDPTISFDEHYALEMAELDLLPEKKNALQVLAEHYDFHVISGTISSIIIAYLERHGVHEHFTDILGSDVHTSKVHRFKLLCEKYSIDPKEIVFITDTVGDLHEAFEVGVGTTIAVCDGFQPRELLMQQNPTHVVESLLDVPALLLN